MSPSIANLPIDPATAEAALAELAHAGAELAQARPR